MVAALTIQPAGHATRRRRSNRAAAAVTAKNQANSIFDAGADTRRTVAWQAPTVSANRGLLESLARLRDRSRQSIRNNGYAKGVIDALITEMIGTGIKPMSQAPNAEWRRAVHALWMRWTDESDADGQLDFYGQQAQAARGWLEAGDSFTRMRFRLPTDGLTVPLQLQVLEAEMCPHTWNQFVLPNGNRVRAGIEFTPIGRRAAYYFHPAIPGDFQDYDLSQLRRVPAEVVVQLYDPLRPGQLRGLPHLTQALIKLYELDKFDDATLMRQQIANMFAAFITKPTSVSETPMDPITGLPMQTNAAGEQLSGMSPGIMQMLAPGEEINFSNPPDAGQAYPDFMRQQLFAVSAATGVPYEVLTGDMSKVNDRTVRVILQKFRRRIMAYQHQIIAFQFCRPIWAAWIDRAILSGALAMPPDYLANPEPWTRVAWKPQGWPYLQPVQDVEAQQAAIRAGFTSRSSTVSEQGEDAELVDAEQAADNARADGLGLRYDSDGRQETAPKPATLVKPPTEPAAPQGASA